jgi:hypothetical protein
VSGPLDSGGQENSAAAVPVLKVKVAVCFQQLLIDGVTYDSDPEGYFRLPRKAVDCLDKKFIIIGEVK